MGEKQFQTGNTPPPTPPPLYRCIGLYVKQITLIIKRIYRYYDPYAYINTWKILSDFIKILSLIHV